MPRYIDADLIPYAESEFGSFDDCAYRYDINEIPTADVAEAKHGEWKKSWCDNNLIGHEYEECSVCGCSLLDTNQFWNSNYCPNCGAKMDLNK